MTSSPRPTAAVAATTSHPAHTLLSRAHSPDSAARIFNDKIKNKPLLVQPTSTTTTAPTDKRALRRHVRLRKKEYHLRKRKPQPLSAKEKRALGAFRLKKEEVNYEIYKSLHEMWTNYMLEVLGYMRDGHVVGTSTSTPGARNAPPPPKSVTAQSQGSLLSSADFHGAEIEVVQCSDAGKVGIKGIVVRDTKFTFVVVTPGNQVRTLPKRDTVFKYEIELPLLSGAGKEGGNVGEEWRKKLVFEVHGNQFEFRPAERANRKFKWKVMDYL